ncbi:hypothetical protein ACFFU1_01725 [Algibacter miyuki]|uniref:Polysaccharide chain length determinant N-terminal domain-containing protein n=1 Tax=Algibacter miyuki TaxID=1306933 RepID=A0ABV5GVE7_9FLAO|nr:hypothetical protein [Algibacter miyuki]MDN3664931.1 hypothetical protein [Algibacter miyuki]
MSKELPQQPKQSEEVDLGQLFKLIGNAFDRLFTFIGSIFKTIFSVIIYALRAVLDNIKIIVVSVIIAGVLGYGLEKTKKPVFSSSMLVKPYFDSKFQLVTNVNYYNALIGVEDYKSLADLFSIDEQDAVQLQEFKISPGPETENDRIIQYDRFVRSIDSVRAQGVSFKDYIENRSIYTGDIFQISVVSEKKDIFKSLEDGLNSTFTNSYSTKKMKKRDSLIDIRKARVKSSLKQIDSLKNVYISVMEGESKRNDNQSISMSKDGVLVQEKTVTREFDLLEKQIGLQQELSALESQKVEEDVFFDTISGFQEVGTKYHSWKNRYSLIFPVLAFILLIVGYLVRKSIAYIINYEA